MPSPGSDAVLCARAGTLEIASGYQQQHPSPAVCLTPFRKSLFVPGGPGMHPQGISVPSCSETFSVPVGFRLFWGSLGPGFPETNARASYVVTSWPQLTSSLSLVSWKNFACPGAS